MAGGDRPADAPLKNAVKLLHRMRMMAKKREGVSLIEVLIVVMISASIIFVVGSFRANLDTLQNFVGQKLQSRQDIDQTIQILETEVRSSGPSSLGAYPIESAGTSSFAFFVDVDKDGLFERVRYFLGTSSVQKGVIKPVGNPLVYATSSEIITSIIANVIPSTTTPLFAYYDAAYTGTQSAMTYPIDVTAIRLIEFSVYADSKASSTPKAEFFTTTVTVRNLRSN
jgi:Flp pilus assembly pilin Flp